MKEEDKNIGLAEETRIDEIELLLDLLLSHKKEHIQDFLRSKGLTYSYPKDTLREKIKDGIKKRILKPEELIDLLDKIEEYGNQHVYLYTNTSNYIEKLKKEEFIKKQLRKSGLDKLYNTRKPLLIPDFPTIAAIIHNDKILKIKWVEKRKWYELINEEVKGDKLIRTYQIYITRGVTIFRVDLVTGNAELFIQRLPSGTNYAKVKESYENEIKKIVNLDTFSPLNLKSSIKKIESSGEVERRQINLETIGGGKVTFKSRSRGADYISDPSLRNARNALGGKVSGDLGIFYWLPQGPLTRKIHTHIYGWDSRVGIFGECNESEVNYVLSRVRFFAQ